MPALKYKGVSFFYSIHCSTCYKGTALFLKYNCCINGYRWLLSRQTDVVPCQSQRNTVTGWQSSVSMYAADSFFFGIPELFHLQFKQDPASEQGGSNLNGGSVPGTLKSEMRIKEYPPASQACEKHTDHSSLSLFSNILHSTHFHLFQYFSLFWFLFLKLSNFCFFSSFFPRMVVFLFFSYFPVSAVSLLAISVTFLVLSGVCNSSQSDGTTGISRCFLPSFTTVNGLYSVGQLLLKRAKEF